MTTSDLKLTEEQKELVAIGASVGVGCLPCASYHFETSRKVGLEPDRMLGAATEAERVVTDARERVSAHVRAKLGSDVEEPKDASPLDRSLAAFGAAIGANSLPNIRRHMLAVAESGLSGAQIAQAITVARGVQEAAARGHVKETERVLERFGASLAAAADDDLCAGDCACHAEEVEANAR